MKRTKCPNTATVTIKIKPNLLVMGSKKHRNTRMEVTINARNRNRKTPGRAASPIS